MRQIAKLQNSNHPPTHLIRKNQSSYTQGKTPLYTNQQAETRLIRKKSRSIRPSKTRKEIKIHTATQNALLYKPTSRNQRFVGTSLSQNKDISQMSPTTVGTPGG